MGKLRHRRWGDLPRVGHQWAVEPGPKADCQGPLSPLLSYTHFCFSTSFLCSKVSVRRALLGIPARRLPSVSVTPTGDVPSLCSAGKKTELTLVPEDKLGPARLWL